MKRIWRALFYSLHGFAAAWHDEEAFRQEVLLALVLLPLAVVLAPSGVGFALMAGSVLLVLVVELLNSAVEAAIDRVGEEFHALSKKAKDLGSAAVFLSLVNVVVVWGAVLW